MGRIIVVILFFICLNANAISRYCKTPANGGNDANPGTNLLPYATWEKLASVLNAGDTGWIGGGTYRTTKLANATVHCSISRSGTSANPIVMINLPGELPYFNLDNISSNAGSTCTIVQMSGCNWFKLIGLKIGGLVQTNTPGNYPYAMQVFNGSNNTLERLELYNCAEGVQFGMTSSSVANVINCDSHHHLDPFSPNAYNGSNGFSCTMQPLGSIINFTGCRAWMCGDDGFDLFGSATRATFNNCWSFWNGYRFDGVTTAGNGCGYKLGGCLNGNCVNFLSSGTLHFLNECLAFYNRQQGFDQNNGIIINRLFNNTSYHNGGIGYHFGYQQSLNIPHELRNNISFQDAGGARPAFSASWVQSNNTWNGLPATPASFASLDTTGVTGPRGANGELPILPFAHLIAGSNMIGQGINVGLPGANNPPDLGAYQFSSAGTVTQTKYFGRKL